MFSFLSRMEVITKKIPVKLHFARSRRERRRPHFGRPIPPFWKPFPYVVLLSRKNTRVRSKRAFPQRTFESAQSESQTSGFIVTVPTSRVDSLLQQILSVTHGQAKFLIESGGFRPRPEPPDKIGRAHV